jgi:hypothetical protein
LVYRHAQIVGVGYVVFEFSLALLPRALALKFDDRIPGVPGGKRGSEAFARIKKNAQKLFLAEHSRAKEIK